MFKTLAHIIGPLAGTVVVFLILHAETYLWTLVKYDNEYRNHLDWMFSDLYIFGTFFIFALIVQFVVIRPLFKKWYQRRRLNRRNLLGFGFILSITSGIIFGSLFGSAEDISDIFITITIGTIVFSIYYLITFKTYLKLS